MSCFLFCCLYPYFVQVFVTIYIYLSLFTFIYLSLFTCLSLSLSLYLSLGLFTSIHLSLFTSIYPSVEDAWRGKRHGRGHRNGNARAQLDQKLGLYLFT